MNSMKSLPEGLKPKDGGSYSAMDSFFLIRYNFDPVVKDKWLWVLHQLPRLNRG